jgi:hypothetical protein
MQLMSWNAFLGALIAVDPKVWEFFAAIGTVAAVAVSVTFG